MNAAAGKGSVDATCYDDRRGPLRARSCSWVSERGSYRIELHSGNASIKRQLAAGVFFDPEIDEPLSPE